MMNLSVLSYWSCWIAFLSLQWSGSGVAADELAAADPNWVPYPNMNAALYGYDLMKADPFTSAVGGDPGWRNPVLVPTEYKGGVVTLHGSIDGRDALQCNGDKKTKDVTTLKQYKEQQLQSVYSGYGLQILPDINVEVSAEVAGVGGSVSTTIPPFLTRSSTETEDTTKIEEFLSTEKRGMVIMEAVCSVSIIKVVPHIVPQFHDGFKAAVQDLWNAAVEFEKSGGPFGSSKDDGDSRSVFKGFIDGFGTHYSTSTIMGSKLVYQVRFSENERLQESVNRITKCAEVKGTKLFGLQTEKDSNDCDDNDTFDNNLNSKTVSREAFTSFGSKPKKDMHEWSQQTFDQPMPLRMSLKPLIDLFSQQNLAAINSSIDPTRLWTWLTPLWRNLCEITHPGQCYTHRTGQKKCGINDGCKWDQQCREDKDEPQGYSCSDKEVALTCQVQVEDRVECGDGQGEDKARKCIDMNCCYDHHRFMAFVKGQDPLPKIPRCYKKAEPKVCSRNPISRIMVKGNPQREKCTTKGHCYDKYSYTTPTFLNEFLAPMCYYKRQDPECSVNPVDRISCAPAGVSPEVCFTRGCCYNKHLVQSPKKFCYHREKPMACSVNPDDRVECGWPGITEKECKKSKCCFNSADNYELTIHPGTADKYKQIPRSCYQPATYVAQRTSKSLNTMIGAVTLDEDAEN